MEGYSGGQSPDRCHGNQTERGELAHEQGNEQMDFKT